MAYWHNKDGKPCKMRDAVEFGWDHLSYLLIFIILCLVAFIFRLLTLLSK